MKIECPKCFKKNNLNLEAKVNCGHCKEEITGYTYKKPIISATTALVIGVGGFYVTDRYVLPEDRYPVAVEYSLIDSCVSSSRGPMRYRHYERKQDVCFCSLEETMKDVSFRDYKKNENEFLETFAANVKKCK